VTVLVAVASKYGSTREIGQAIAEELRASDVDADLRDAGDVTSLDGYEAVVLGSAVYMGNWLEAVKELAHRQAASLAARPTWLFSSGPIGGKPMPDEAVDVSAIVEATRARGHRLFGGKLERHRLGFAERALTLALRIPEGDFRDWDEIRAWARHIASSVASDSSSLPSPTTGC
jgi:menaquinone-dependent protoporphyrinogen oxidase